MLTDWRVRPSPRPALLCHQTLGTQTQNSDQGQKYNPERLIICQRQSEVCLIAVQVWTIRNLTELSWWRWQWMHTICLVCVLETISQYLQELSDWLLSILIYGPCTWYPAPVWPHTTPGYAFSCQLFTTYYILDHLYNPNISFYSP